MRSAQDVRARTVILLELDDFGTGKILLEFEDVADVGAPPLIDALVVVPDDAEVAVDGSQHVYELVLQHIRILILVDHQIAEALLVLSQNVRVTFEQLHGPQNQVVEVHRVVLFELPLVALV